MVVSSAASFASASATGVKHLGALLLSSSSRNVVSKSAIPMAAASSSTLHTKLWTQITSSSSLHGTGTPPPPARGVKKNQKNVSGGGVGAASNKRWLTLSSASQQKVLATDAGEMNQTFNSTHNYDNILTEDFKLVSPTVIQIPVSGEQGKEGLKCYVGVHAPVTQCRPGNGGLRLWSYNTDEEAIEECRQLSRGMSLKHEIYNTGFSGAKLVANAKEPMDVDKKSLMEDVAKALHSLNGSVYTGCDMNTDFQDMKYLSELCPYVLASLDSTIDANKSTAHGVVGSVVEASDQLLGGHKRKKYLVLGAGKVGSYVCELLAILGGEVSAFDTDPARADNIQNVRNVSSERDGKWWELDHDVLVPCCSSGVITREVVEQLKSKIIVGATNIPFESQDVLAKALERDMVFIPDMLSSAGAVLADSIEHYSHREYHEARDSEVYAFVQTLTSEKTKEYLGRLLNSGNERERTGTSQQNEHPMKALTFVHEDKKSAPVGKKFSTWRNSEEDTYDIVVVGGGMAGTATSYYLSKLAPDLKVAVLESGELADKKGSSYGASRMYRRMYSDEYFSRMQSQALDLWSDLEKESNTKLLKENGLLFYGETDTGETVEGSIPGAAEIMKKLGIPHEYFNAKQMDSKWPMLAKEGYEGVYEATAGSINSSLACSTMMDLARKQGHSLYTSTSVLDIGIPSPGSVHITCSDGKLIKSKQIILAAGAWTNDLLKHVDVQLDLEIWAMHWGHYKVQEELKKQYPQWFCFRKEVPEKWDGGLYYGFPIEGEEPMIKVGIDFCPEDPEFRMRKMADYNYTPNETIVNLIDSFVKENWKGVGERVDMYSNPYTCTRDQYFVLDSLRERPEISLFTGGCGRAFKFAPLLGKLLAEKALNLPASYDISPFSADRDCVRFKKDSISAQL